MDKVKKKAREAKKEMFRYENIKRRNRASQMKTQITGLDGISWYNLQDLHPSQTTKISQGKWDLVNKAYITIFSMVYFWQLVTLDGPIQQTKAHILSKLTIWEYLAELKKFYVALSSLWKKRWHDISILMNYTSEP